MSCATIAGPKAIFLRVLRRLLITMIAGLSIPGAMHASRAAAVEVIATGLQFAEGTIFVGNTLYFVDYSASDVLRLAGNKTETVWHQNGCGANGLLEVPQGLLVACYDANTVVLISRDGNVLNTISKDDTGQSFHSPNDLAADAKGGVYFSASGSGDVLGKVYYRSADQRVKEVAANINYANGLAVSPDGTVLYLAESKSRRLLAFEIAGAGTLSHSREFVKLSDILPAGRVYTPDGVRIDKYGRLFIGLFDGGGFAVINPEGKLIQQVDLPGPHHAALAISPDGRFVYGTTVYDEPTGYRGELYRVPNPVIE
jgi:gluconolactonase